MLGGKPERFSIRPVKTIASEEASRARESRAGSVKFTPKFKVCVETNYAPVTRIDKTLNRFLDRSRRARARLIMPRGGLPVAAATIKIVFI